jgi:hypothetical protein
MNNLKKVGLTALAGSLAAVSANAAEMSVSGATMLTYTSKGPSEVTGNPFWYENKPIIYCFRRCKRIHCILHANVSR